MNLIDGIWILLALNARENKYDYVCALVLAHVFQVQCSCVESSTRLRTTHLGHKHCSADTRKVEVFISV